MSPYILATAFRDTAPQIENEYQAILNNFAHHKWMFIEENEPYLDTGNSVNKFPITAFNAGTANRIEGNVIGPIFGQPVVGAMVLVGQYPGGNFYTPQNLDGTTTWFDQTSAVGAFGGFFRVGIGLDKRLMDLASQSSGANNLTVGQAFRIEVIQSGTDFFIRVTMLNGSNSQYWQTDNPVWEGGDRVAEWKHIVALQPGDGGGVHVIVDGVDVPVTRTIIGGSPSQDDWLNTLAAANTGSYIRFGPEPSNGPFSPEASAFGASGCFVVTEAITVQDITDLYDAANTSTDTPLDYDEAIKVIHVNSPRPENLPEIWVPFLSPVVSGKYWSLGGLQGGYHVLTDSGDGTVIPTLAQTGKLRKRGGRSDATSWLAAATTGTYPRRYGSIADADQGTAGVIMRCPAASGSYPRGILSFSSIQTGVSPKWSWEITLAGGNFGFRVVINQNGTDQALWVTGTVPLTVGEWYRLFLVKEAASLTLYVNGTAYAMTFSGSGAGSAADWIHTTDNGNTDFYVAYSPRDTSGQQVRDLNEPIAEYLLSRHKFTPADIATIEDAVDRAQNLDTRNNYEDLLNDLGVDHFWRCDDTSSPLTDAVGNWDISTDSDQVHYRITGPVRGEPRVFGFAQGTNAVLSQAASITLSERPLGSVGALGGWIGFNVAVSNTEEHILLSGVVNNNTGLQWKLALNAQGEIIMELTDAPTSAFRARWVWNSASISDQWKEAPGDTLVSGTKINFVVVTQRGDGSGALLSVNGATPVAADSATYDGAATADSWWSDFDSNMPTITDYDIRLKTGGAWLSGMFLFDGTSLTDQNIADLYEATNVDGPITEYTEYVKACDPDMWKPPTNGLRGASTVEPSWWEKNIGNMDAWASVGERTPALRFLGANQTDIPWPRADLPGTPYEIDAIPSDTSFNQITVISSDDDFSSRWSAVNDFNVGTICATIEVPPTGGQNRTLLECADSDRSHRIQIYFNDSFLVFFLQNGSGNTFTISLDRPFPVGAVMQVVYRQVGFQVDTFVNGILRDGSDIGTTLAGTATGAEWFHTITANGLWRVAMGARVGSPSQDRYRAAIWDCWTSRNVLSSAQIRDLWDITRGSKARVDEPTFL